MTSGTSRTCSSCATWASAISERIQVRQRIFFSRKSRTTERSHLKMSTTCGPIAARSRADSRVKSSIVLFSVGNRIDIQSSIVISRVAGRVASRRASVDFPAAIFPQRRCNVVGQAVFIVTDYQLPALSPVIHPEANLPNASQLDDSPVPILLQKSL